MRTRGATRNWQQRAQSLYKSTPTRSGIDWKSKMAPSQAPSPSTMPPMPGGGGAAQSAPTFQGGAGMAQRAPSFQGGGGMAQSAPMFKGGQAPQMERMDPPGAPQQMPMGSGGGASQSGSTFGGGGMSAFGPRPFGGGQPIGRGPALQPAQNMQQGAGQDAQPSPLVDAMTGQQQSAQAYGPAMIRRFQ